MGDYLWRVDSERPDFYHLFNWLAKESTRRTTVSLKAIINWWILGQAPFLTLSRGTCTLRISLQRGVLSSTVTSKELLGYQIGRAAALMTWTHEVKWDPMPNLKKCCGIPNGNTPVTCQ